MAFFAEILGFSIFAGFIGSLVGVGGGILVVPFLTLVMGVGFHEAAGASIVSVIATSSGAGAAFLRDRLVNLRLGLFLNVATVAGAVAGALLTGVASPRVLGGTLGAVLLYSAISTLQTREPETFTEPPQEGSVGRLRLHGSYHDTERGEVHYRVPRNLTPSMVMMFLAGILSGLLGIGSGAFKVLVMDKMLRLPIKVSTTTSNFMLGITAAASAGMYFTRGYIQPSIAAPVSLGILIGALLGAKVLRRISNTVLRWIFFAILLLMAWRMIQNAWNGGTA